MRILVTGATGFLGASLLAALKPRTHDVFALCRSDASATRVKGLATPIMGDLRQPQGLANALASAQPEVIVHLAAQIASTRSTALIDKVNAEGSASLIEAAVTANVRRFVFTSTVVTGDAKGAMLVESEPLPVDTPYGRSKQHTETLLLEQRAKGALEVVILRPSHVYGPGGWFENMVRDVAKGKFAIPGTGQNLWDMVHLDDVTTALTLAIDAESPSPVYHVVDDKPVKFEAVIALIAQAAEARMPWHVPVWLARLVAGRNAIDAAVRSARSSNALLKAELGWVPIHPHSEEAIPSVVRTLLASSS